jgi:hypothetical protein
VRQPALERERIDHELSQPILGQGLAILPAQVDLDARESGFPKARELGTADRVPYRDLDQKRAAIGPTYDIRAQIPE